MTGLTDKQQGYLMLAVFVLPVLITWLANGSPVDRTALSLVGSGILAGVLAFIKESLGTTPPPAPKPVPATSTPSPTA